MTTPLTDVRLREIDRDEYFPSPDETVEVCRELLALRARVRQVEQSALSLAKDCGGVLSAFEHKLRPIIGNSNFGSMSEKVTAVRALLDAPPAGGEEQ